MFTTKHWSDSTQSYNKCDASPGECPLGNSNGHVTFWRDQIVSEDFVNKHQELSNEYAWLGISVEEFDKEFIEIDEEGLPSIKGHAITSPQEDTIKGSQLEGEEKEIVSRAISTAATHLAPAFRSAIALMVPFRVDDPHLVAGTDPYSRVGFGDIFFTKFTPRQRALVILHETMHVLNRHHNRGSAIGVDLETMNIAGDFEINSTIDNLTQGGVDFGIMPDREPYNFPRNLLMEKYVELLKNKQQEECAACASEKNETDNSSSSSQNNSTDEESPSENPNNESNNENTPSEGSCDSENPNSTPQPHTCGKKGGKPTAGSGCGGVSQEIESAADKLGIEKISEQNQRQARDNTIERLSEEANRARRAGNASLANAIDGVITQMRPPKVSWKRLFNNLLSRRLNDIVRGHRDYSYRRPNRRFAGNPDGFIMPSTVSYQPKVMMGVDTSGSMGGDDYEASLIEIEAIIKQVKQGSSKGFPIFSVDSEVKETKAVSNVRDLKLTGGGGTQMSKAWEYADSLPPADQPDMLVLATDAHLMESDWAKISDKVKTKNYRSVILTTNKDGFNSAPKELKDAGIIFDISEE